MTEFTKEYKGGFVAYTPDYKFVVVETSYGEVIHVAVERVRFLHPQEETK